MMTRLSRLCCDMLMTSKKLSTVIGILIVACVLTIGRVQSQVQTKGKLYTFFWCLMKKRAVDCATYCGFLIHRKCGNCAYKRNKLHGHGFSLIRRTPKYIIMYGI